MCVHKYVYILYICGYMTTIQIVYYYNKVSHNDNKNRFEAIPEGKQIHKEIQEYY